MAKKKQPEFPRLLQNPEDTPENPITWERLMDWLAWTGWFEGYIRKRISPMDALQYEDYVQSCWVELLERPHDYIVEIYKGGKGRFINYVKCLIDNQIKSDTSAVYKTNKKFYHDNCLLSDEQWKAIEEGEQTTMHTASYPVRFMCPSGNRKKMCVMEYEDRLILLEEKFTE